METTLNTASRQLSQETALAMKALDKDPTAKSTPKVRDDCSTAPGASARWLALVVALVATSTSAYARANIDCLIYASDAERAQRMNAKTCRQTGPRWDADFMAHYNWCVSVSGSQRNAETAARERELDACPLGATSQGLVNGDAVPVTTQKELGLVTVFARGACSGTLINRYWVLTADHCVTSDGQEGGPDQPLNQIAVRAAWNPNQFPAQKVVRYSDRGLDVALVMLGEAATALGGSTKLLYPHDPFGLSDSEIAVNAYGRGLNLLATEGPPQMAGTFDGAFRSGVFVPRLGSPTEYYFSPNAGNQIIGGGDSGGPDHVLSPSGSLLGIVGVHSRCWFDYATGRGDRPDGSTDWQWAVDIDLCESAAIYTIRDEIIGQLEDTPVNRQSGLTEESDGGMLSNVEIVGAGMSNNTDRPGSDFRRFEIDGRMPQACQRACEEDGRCKAWTYVRPGVQGPQAFCYLKNPSPAARSSDCCISGEPLDRQSVLTRQVPNLVAGQDRTDRPGNDYARFEFDGQDAGVCQRACAEDDRCRAWTHVKPGYQGSRSVCYLKSPAPAAQPNDCCTSGTKN